MLYVSEIYLFHLRMIFILSGKIQRTSGKKGGDIENSGQMAEKSRMSQTGVAKVEPLATGDQWGHHVTPQSLRAYRIAT